jgi:RNA polymerase sigma factor FliA
MKRASIGISNSRRLRNSALSLRRSGSRREAVAAAGDDRLLELLPQVRFIARRIHSRLPAHVPFDDLLQAGVLGLLDALRKFDPGRRVQLESYMKFRIRGAILDELRSLDWSPRELRRKARGLDEAEQQLRARLGREPTAAELAKALGISLAQYHRLTRELRGLDLGSLQEAATCGEEGMEQDLTSRLASPGGTSPLAMYTGQEQRTRLEEGLRRLPERERVALTLYYYEELTMKEVGEVLAVGESRVSQLHSSALARLRQFLDGESYGHTAGSGGGETPARAGLQAMDSSVA